MASTSVAGALVSSPARLAGGVAGDQPPRFPRLGGGRPRRVSLLSDPGLPRRRRTGPETSRLSYGLSGEGVLVRVRTYGFPGVLRGLPGPRLATIPTSQPRRSLSSPGDVLCASSVAVGRLSSPRRVGSDTEVVLPAGGGAAGPPWPDEKDAVPGRLRNPFRPASAVFLGGAASHLFGLALAARSRVDVNLASAGAEGNAPASCYPLLAVKSCPAVPDRAVPPLRAPARRSRPGPPTR